MTKREKIILGIMTVAVIGGGLHLASPSGRRPAALPARPAGPDLTALVTEVQAGLRESRLNDREEKIIALAETPWSRTPFLPRALPASAGWVDQQPERDRLPVYTGFLAIGNRVLALIDGRDYRKNELLAGGEFRVAGIFPDRVELIREGAATPVRIPLTEETNHDEAAH